MAESRGKKKNLIGSVIRGGMNKTVVVRVEHIVKHPRYGKYMRRHVKYLAHDERKECTVGDKVLMIESCPISRTKRWRVSKVLEKA